MKKEDILVEIYAARNAVKRLEKAIEDAGVGIENNAFVRDAFEKKWEEEGWGEIPKQKEKKDMTGVS